MLKAYIDLLSQPSRALYMFLKYTKIPHVVVPISIMQGEHLQDDYAKINPFQVLPVINDNGFILPESVAILQYLCNKHHVDSLYPKDLQQRAKIEGFTHWHHLNLRYGGSNMIFALYREPLRTGKPINQKRLSLCAKVLESSLQKIETIYLRDTPFISSDSMTIADLLGVCEVMQTNMGLGMVYKSSFPKVIKWTQLVRDTIGSALFDEAHQPLSELGEHFKGLNIPTPKL